MYLQVQNHSLITTHYVGGQTLASHHLPPYSTRPLLCIPLARAYNAAIVTDHTISSGVYLYSIMSPDYDSVRVSLIMHVIQLLPPLKI